MLHLISTALMHIAYAQCLDTLPYNEANMTQEYLDANHMISTYGLMRPSVIFPMYLVNIRNPEVLERMQKIMMKMGKLWQIQVSKDQNYAWSKSLIGK